MNITFILFVLFFIWSFPALKYRSDFRKMAYRTNDWKINIMPFFIRELSVLFGFEARQSEKELRLIRFYRMYLCVYFALLFLLLWYGDTSTLF